MVRGKWCASWALWLLPVMGAAHGGGLTSGLMQNKLLAHGQGTAAGGRGCAFCAQPDVPAHGAWRMSLPRLVFDAAHNIRPTGQTGNHLARVVPVVGWESSLGWSINLLRGHTSTLSLYVDANWADLFNDASLQTIVAHIGLRYQFL